MHFQKMFSLPKYLAARKLALVVINEANIRGHRLYLGIDRYRRSSSNISDCVRRLCLLVTRAPHPFEYFNRELQPGLEVSRFAGGINKVRRPRCSMLYIAYPPFHLLRLSGILGSSLVSIVFFHVLPSVLLVICSFPAGPPYTGQQISVMASSFFSVDYHISSPILPRDIL